MGEKMLRTIWQLPLNAVDGVPETILEIGRQARQARIDLAACDGVAFQLGLGGPDMLERREVGRHFPDHIAVTRPAEHDEALATMLGCLLQRALRFGGGFSVAADDQEIGSASWRERVCQYG